MPPPPMDAAPPLGEPPVVAAPARPAVDAPPLAGEPPVPAPPLLCVEPMLPPPVLAATTTPLPPGLLVELPPARSALAAPPDGMPLLGGFRSPLQAAKGNVEHAAATHQRATVSRTAVFTSIPRTPCPRR